MEISRILKYGGFLTILTDNRWYGLYILRSLGSFSSAIQLRSMAVPASSNTSIIDTAGEFHLYSGLPNESIGHVVTASSYFDRLWKRSAQSERFFLVLEKRKPAQRKRPASTTLSKNSKKKIR